MLAPMPTHGLQVQNKIIIKKNISESSSITFFFGTLSQKIYELCLFNLPINCVAPVTSPDRETQVIEKEFSEYVNPESPFLYLYFCTQDFMLQKRT